MIKVIKKIYFVFFLMVEIFNASPVNVSNGGTGASSFTAYSVLCAGTISTGAFQSVVGLGSSGQGLVSAGAAALPAWGNVFPGYIAGTGFAHAGTTSTLSSSPNNCMIITTSVPSTIISSAIRCTALGYEAFRSIPASLDGSTAVGSLALRATTTGGTFCTAVGYQALKANTSGASNIAIGVNAMLTNTSEDRCLAIGNFALENSNSDQHVAIGYKALNAKTSSGLNCVAVGYQAGLLIAGGGSNVACGYNALQTNVSGANNTAFGYQALNLSTGSQNVGVGSGAGATATTGSNNIYIGYNATPISTTESNNIVIGNSSHVTAYMFGITGVTTALGVDVFVNSAGKLGTTTSSKRFKENIEPVKNSKADDLLKLRVVSFKYISDDSNEIQYGMIAEEVLNIFPETIVYDLSGEIQTIQYHKFIPLLIKELQVKNDEISSLELDLELLNNQIAVLEEKIG